MAKHPTTALRVRLGSAVLAAALFLALVPACTATQANRANGSDSPMTSQPGSTVPSPLPHAWPPKSPKPLPARFKGTTSTLPAALAAKMQGTTWHPGCPVPLSRLRLLTLRYWGFDGRVHEGPMVVNTIVARQVVTVFQALFQARFPIETMRLAVRYRPNHDDPNDKRDYTAGFNCRPVLTARGPINTFSQHSYGWAIDINPIQNPYVTFDGYVRNKNARPFRNRSLRRPGMIHPDDRVVRAFASIGWKWGGYWAGDKDYMHFSLTGR